VPPAFPNRSAPPRRARSAHIVGASTLNVEVAPKRPELIHEVLPAAANLALLINPTSSLAGPVSQALEAAATALRLKLHVLNASSERDQLRRPQPSQGCSANNVRDTKDAQRSQTGATA
jgi:hypothetical protein